MTGSAMQSSAPRAVLDCLVAYAPRNDGRRLRPDQSISVFGERQDLSDPDLNRCRGRNILRPLAGVALDRVDGVEADVELDALRGQAFDQLAIGIVRKQKLDARPERHHLDRDLIGIVK